MAGPQAGEEELNTGLVVIGIDPALDPRVASALKVREGSFFSGDKDEILLPQAIAGDIGVELGQEVILAVMTKTGYYNMEKATLVGIIDVPPAAFVFGTYLGYVQLAQAQRLLDTNQVSELVLADNALGPISSLQGPFNFSPALSNLSTSKAISMAYLLLQLIIVAFLAVFSIGIVYQNMLMINEERLAEIGVYLSYGARPGWIQALFLTELAVYTLFCAVIGGLAALVLMGALTMLGLKPFDMVSDLMLGGQALDLWPQPWHWIQTCLLVLAFVLGAAAKPIIDSSKNTAIVKLFRK
jgi:ABC-type lipoprotein release transport system permease subunit